MNSNTALRPLVAERPEEPYQIISPATEEPYAHRVARVYADSPEDWQKILGPGMWFQFGVYPMNAANISLDESGRLYLEQQLALAGFGPQGRSQPARILDVGCGWGGPLVYLAHRFDRCEQLDGVNISPQQLEHAHRMIRRKGLQDRITLYHCNAQDIDRLPGARRPYDLVMFRGSITHFPYSVLERAMGHVRRSISRSGKVIITDNLYNVPLAEYRSPLPDEIDRIACGHRKTPEYLREVLARASFRIDDLRVLPSRDDTVRWLVEVQRNIESHFTSARPPAIEELYESCENQILALQRGLYSVYSLVASPC